MKKQTSVDWLAERIFQLLTDRSISNADYVKLLGQAQDTARKMHREEVEYGYRVGLEDGVDNTNGEMPLYSNASEYYTQTFETP